MKLLWRPFAEEDRRAIFLYIATDNIAAAEALDDRIASCARQLLDFPGSGREGRISNTRELVIPGTRYLIVYSASQETTEIIRVLHTAQNGLRTKTRRQTDRTSPNVEPTPTEKFPTAFS